MSRREYKRATLGSACYDDATGLVMAKQPRAVLVDEDVGGAQEAAFDDFATDDNRDGAEDGHVLGPGEKARLGRVRQDAAPAFEDGIAAGQGAPAGMDAEHWRVAGPDGLHCLEVAVIEGPIEGFVRGEHVFVHDGMIAA